MTILNNKRGRRALLPVKDQQPIQVPEKIFYNIVVTFFSFSYVTKIVQFYSFPTESISSGTSALLIFQIYRIFQTPNKRAIIKFSLHSNNRSGKAMVFTVKYSGVQIININSRFSHSFQCLISQSSELQI